MGIVSDPLVVLEEDIHARFAAGHRLAIVWRLKWTKSNDGFVEVYTSWIDPAFPSLFDYTIKYQDSGFTLHPNNIDRVGYTRTGLYYSDKNFYQQEIIDEGSGIFVNGKQQHATYIERPTWADHTHAPEFTGLSVSEILGKHKLMIAT